MTSDKTIKPMLRTERETEEELVLSPKMGRSLLVRKKKYKKIKIKALWLSQETERGLNDERFLPSLNETDFVVVVVASRGTRRRRRRFQWFIVLPIGAATRSASSANTAEKEGNQIELSALGWCLGIR